MDESTLRAQIELLNGQISSLEWWLHLWTIIVIVGCAGESISIVVEYWDDKKEWFLGRLKSLVPFPEKPSLLMLFVDVVSVALVVVGIAGELYIDFQSSDLQTKLRDANSQLVLILEKEVESAAKSAKEAHDESSAAKKTSGEANEIAAGAREEALKVEAKSKVLGSRLASASAKLDDIERRMAWRTLTKEQKELIAFDLSKLSKPHLTVVVNPQDMEALFFAKEIVDFLKSKEVGWSATLDDSLMVGGGVGLNFVAKKTEIKPTDPDFPSLLPIFVLSKDLQTYQLLGSFTPSPDLDARDSRLTVGTKIPVEALRIINKTKK